MRRLPVSRRPRARRAVALALLACGPAALAGCPGGPAVADAAAGATHDGGAPPPPAARDAGAGGQRPDARPGVDAGGPVDAGGEKDPADAGWGPGSDSGLDGGVDATVDAAVDAGRADAGAAPGADAGLRLHHWLSHRNFVPSFGRSGPTQTLPLAVNPAPIPRDPGTRVFVYLDMTINGAPPPAPEDYFHALRVALGQDCALDLRATGVFTQPALRVTEPFVIDVGDGPRRVVPDAVGEGVSLFDVTGLRLGSCDGRTPLEALDDVAPHFLWIGVRSDISWVSAVRLYLGR
jgi:hypothetical protein